eukprot:PhM_4_TR11640/c0_g1_i1/m.68209
MIMRHHDCIARQALRSLTCAAAYCASIRRFSASRRRWRRHMYDRKTDWIFTHDRTHRKRRSRTMCPRHIRWILRAPNIYFSASTMRRLSFSFAYISAEASSSSRRFSSASRCALIIFSLSYNFFANVRYFFSRSSWFWRLMRVACIRCANGLLVDGSPGGDALRLSGSASPTPMPRDLECRLALAEDASLGGEGRRGDATGGKNPLTCSGDREGDAFEDICVCPWRCCCATPRRGVYAGASGCVGVCLLVVDVREYDPRFRRAMYCSKVVSSVRSCSCSAGRMPRASSRPLRYASPARPTAALPPWLSYDAPSTWYAVTTRGLFVPSSWRRASWACLMASPCCPKAFLTLQRFSSVEDAAAPEPCCSNSAAEVNARAANSCLFCLEYTKPKLHIVSPSSCRPVPVPLRVLAHPSWALCRRRRAVSYSGDLTPREALLADDSARRLAVCTTSCATS